MNSTRIRELSPVGVKTHCRDAFSLIELTVAIAVVALLLSLLVPAIQVVREAGRRMQCQSQLRQIVTAAQSYESANGGFPYGNNNGWSVHVILLPHLEQTPLFQSLDLSVFFEDIVNRSDTLRRTLPSLPYLLCPSDDVAARRLASGPATSYAGNWGMDNQRNTHNGMFQVGLKGVIRTADVTDGLTHTAFFSELLPGSGVPSRFRTVWEMPIPAPIRFPTHLETLAINCSQLTVVVGGDDESRGRAWASGQINVTGYTHTLPPRQPSCIDGTIIQQGAYSSGSQHPGGVNVVFADGHLVFISNDIDVGVWRSWGTRAGERL